MEPDEGFAAEIRGAFDPAGFSVQVVGTGEEALERVRVGPLSLIVLGAELPDMSGFSVCNRLKRSMPQLPLVLYTSEATDQAIEAHSATRTKADGYLRRPFELAELMGHATSLLANAPSLPPPPIPASPPGPPRFPSGGQAEPQYDAPPHDPGAPHGGPPP
ncbi:MAG: response regulator, partial [Anaeromyxobacteraceae bacterium]